MFLPKSDRQTDGRMEEHTDGRTLVFILRFSTKKQKGYVGFSLILHWDPTQICLLEDLLYCLFLIRLG